MNNRLADGGRKGPAPGKLASYKHDFGLAVFNISTNRVGPYWYFAQVETPDDYLLQTLIINPLPPTIDQGWSTKLEF